MSEKDFTFDDEEADKYPAPVQCSSCFAWYNILDHESCPNCGSDEVVGDA